MRYPDNEKSHAAGGRGPLKVALFPSSLSVLPLTFFLTLAVGPLTFLFALLFVALAFLLALPLVALRPLLIRLQITLQCSRFYVSSPMRVRR